MLTTEQYAQLEKLKRIEKIEYTPLSDEDITSMKERIVKEIEEKQSKKFRQWVESWNSLCEWASQLARDNSRLLMEVEYWRAKYNTDGDRG